MCIRDRALDLKENAIWLGKEFFDTEEYKKTQYPSVFERNGTNEISSSWGISLEGYVDLNDRGPENAYAGTLKLKPVTEPYQGKQSEEPTPSGGDCAENALEISIHTLLGDPWRFNGKWVKIQGHMGMASISGEHFAPRIGNMSAGTITLNNRLSEMIEEQCQRLGFRGKSIGTFQASVVGLIEVKKNINNIYYKLTQLLNPTQLTLHPVWEEELLKAMEEQNP